MSEHHEKHEVRVHIDQRAYQSPNPTTGEALYVLGDVPHGHDLFREVEGNHEDELVPRDHTVIHLEQDAHFHSAEHQKEFHIIVNGRQKTAEKRKLSFNDLVKLAYDPVPTGTEVGFVITYAHGPHHNPEGSLSMRETVRIKNGMVFDVTPIDRS